MNIFEQTPPNRRRYGLAAFIGLIAGVVSAFVKWGAEVPLPPRSPVDMFNAACGPESLIRAAGQIDCSRNFLNPPYIFLRDWLGLTDPNAAVYTFAGHVFNWVGVTHIIFSIVFAVGYCVVAEVFPKIKLWQGLLAGALAQLFVHMISFPLMGLTPPLFDLPWYENVSEIFGHLVFLVMYLFLQNFRATIIPTIAVPVVILGTFAILSAVGFTINTLTMFGMVLAIGLLVDDAIVVVENVERVIAEDKLPPKEATHKSMGQIQRALVGIAVVLSAVFMPMAFMSGATGEIYRQFSITLISSMLLSVFVAMSLTPALCATILKAAPEGGHKPNALFARFNTLFEKSTQHYTDSTRSLLRCTGRYMVVYLLICAGMAVLFLRTPTSFLPEEDQGVFMTTAQLPSGATMVNTTKVLQQVTDYYLTKEKDNVQSVFTVGGFGFSGQGQNNGLAFISVLLTLASDSPLLLIISSIGFGGTF
eukprot:195873_1